MQVALFGCRHIKEASKTSHVFFFSFQYDRYSIYTVAQVLLKVGIGETRYYKNIPHNLP